MTSHAGSPQAQLDSVRRSAKGKFLACLLQRQEHGKIERFCRGSEASGATTPERFYLALSLSQQGADQDALAVVRKVVEAFPEHQEARALCYALLLKMALAKTRLEQWQELPQLLAEAKEVTSAGQDFERDFDPVLGAMPFALLCGGDRQNAVDQLEARFLEAPGKSKNLHSLALALWWGASGSREPSLKPCFRAEPWAPAIIYWTLLRNQDAFWEAWALERQQTWGFKLPPEECRGIQEKFLEERFEQVFRDGLDAARQAQDAAGIQAYLSCLESLHLEIKSSIVWQRALKRAAHKIPPTKLAKELCKEVHAAAALAPLLLLPGGFGFLARHGLGKAPLALAKRLEQQASDQDLAGDLLLWFSESGLGRIKVLIEDQKLPEEAAKRLDGKFPDPPAAVAYLRAYAHARVAEQAILHKQNDKALDFMRRAWTGSQPKDVPSHPALSRRIEALHEEIETKFIAAILKGAKDLYDAGQVDLAISRLEEYIKIINNGLLIDHLCNYLCNRGQAKVNGNLCKEAKQDAQKALKYKQGHLLAIQIMGRAFNLEGILEKDPAKASRHFELALEWCPGQPVFMNNLVLEYRSLAIDNLNRVLQPNVANGTILNALKIEIDRLEKAFEIANIKKEYKSDCPAILKTQAIISSETAKKWAASIEDETIKSILDVLADAYEIQHRRFLRHSL